MVQRSFIGGERMKVGDLVRLRRQGWEKIFGVVMEEYNAENSVYNRVAVLWTTTGKIEAHYIDRLEVISEKG